MLYLILCLFLMPFNFFESFLGEILSIAQRLVAFLWCCFWTFQWRFFGDCILALNLFLATVPISDPLKTSKNQRVVCFFFFFFFLGGGGGEKVYGMGKLARNGLRYQKMTSDKVQRSMGTEGSSYYKKYSYFSECQKLLEDVSKKKLP